MSKKPKKAVLMALPPSATPCTRVGYPPIMEAVSDGGQPEFYEADGRRLLRCFGSGDISALQMRGLRIEATTLTFPGGIFYRSLKNDD